MFGSLSLMDTHRCRIAISIFAAPAAAEAFGLAGTGFRTESIYAQLPARSQPAPPAANPPSSPAAASSAQPPVLSIPDGERFAVRALLARPEFPSGSDAAVAPGVHASLLLPAAARKPLRPGLF